MKIGMLASGVLGLVTLKRSINLRPLFIATDRDSKEIILFAHENNIPVFIGNPRAGKLLAFLADETYDVIFSVNYLFLIDNDIIQRAKYPINFHGSLLPKYRGRSPHVWAIINNEKQTGITAHIIEEGCDTGRIILQKPVELENQITGGEVLSLFMAIYPTLLIEVYSLIVQGNLELKIQDHTKATNFGKRTPEDGLINWSWQKERIHNWIRAQAHPYPGAFTILEGNRIIIDRITFCDHGYDQGMENGLIISDSPAVLVKTPNGVIELQAIRTNRLLCIKGKIFNYDNQ